MATPLTSAQVVLTQPLATVYDSVKTFFEKEGFTVGPLVADNFAISAPVTTFESFFHTSLDETLKSGLQSPDLDLDVLPAQIRINIEAILFSRPPDFGPFNP